MSRGSGQGNWAVVDDSSPNSKQKFYLNVCSPLKEVAVGTGCSPFAAVCQTQYTNTQVSAVYTSKYSTQYTNTQVSAVYTG